MTTNETLQKNTETETDTDNDKQKTFYLDLAEKQIFELTNNGSSFIELSFLPNHLINYSLQFFQELFELHPEYRHNVILKGTNCNNEVHRWQKSYLNTPTYDPNDNYFAKKSYMYSGIDDTQNNNELPNLFKPFYNFAKLMDARYNQVIVNWYDEDDYIDFHRDCQRKMQKDVPILIMNLNEDDNKNCRNFELIPCNDDVDAINKTVSVQLVNGLVIKMCGKTQEEFRHGIRKTDNAKKRISISFRAFDEEELKAPSATE
jgi:hypothetical protein